MYKYFLLKVL